MNGMIVLVLLLIIQLNERISIITPLKKEYFKLQSNITLTFRTYRDLKKIINFP